MRVSKRERLMNLVATLLASPGPVPFKTIAGRVVGYDDAAADEALEKRFDRDKAELRRLGIPVRYRTGEDGGLAGYVIPPEEVFQQKVSFTPQESMLLSIAGRVGASATGGGPLEESLKSALRKLSVDLAGLDPLDGVTDVMVLRSRSGDPRALENVSLLGRAVTENRSVGIKYGGMASGECVAREVDPYGLGLVRGAWYLVGHCHLRSALRVFKVSRIQGRVSLSGHEDRPSTFLVPSDFRLEDHLLGEAWEFGEQEPINVTLLAKSGVPIESALPSARKLGEDVRGTRHEIRLRRQEPFISWVLAQGGSVIVLEPAELKEAVAREAERLENRYLGGDAATEPEPSDLPQRREGLMAIPDKHTAVRFHEGA